MVKSPSLLSLFCLHSELTPEVNEIGSLRRFEREMEHEDQQRCQEINKRMGFEGSGVCVVYGEG